MKNLARLCGVLCLVSFASCADARESEGQTPEPKAAPVSAEIVNCGEIQGVVSEGTTAAPKTELGYVHAMPPLGTPTFKPGCPNIEAKLKTRFGIQVVAKGPDSIVPLVTRVTHPPIRNPKSGQTATVDQWDSPMNAGLARYTGWSFDEPWELVPGRWRFEILDGENKVLAAKDFTVTVKK